MIYVFFIILTIVLIMFTDAGVMVNIDNTEFTLYVILFNVIKINIKAKNKRSKAKKETKKKLKNKKLKINFKSISNILSKTKKLISKLKVNVSADVTYGFDEPDITAVSFGTLNALLYPALKLIQNSVKKFKSSIKIKPDLKKRTYNLKSRIVIKVKLIYIIIFALNILFILFKIRRKSEVDK